MFFGLWVNRALRAWVLLREDILGVEFWSSYGENVSFWTRRTCWVFVF